MFGKLKNLRQPLFAKLGFVVGQAGTGGADLADTLFLDLTLKTGDEIRDGHGADIAVDTVADRHGAGALFLFADHEHVGNLLELSFTNLEADFFRTVIAGRPEAACFQFSLDTPAVVAELLTDGQDADLLGRQPEGEGAGKVLDQDADKALHGTEGSAVNHHRPVRAVIGADVFQVKELGQVVVKLHGAELPLTADAIAHDKVDLRSVERGLALLRGVLHAEAADDVHKNALGVVPVILTAHILAAPRRPQADANAIVLQS